MKIISCNYTGNIPGIGRGPVTNVKISDGLYNQLRNMGFALRISTNKVEPLPTVNKTLHVPSLEEKRAATLSATDESKGKISPLKKPSVPLKAEVVEEKKPEEVAKPAEPVVETVAEPEPVKEEVAAEAPAPVETDAEEKAEAAKVLTKDDLEGLSNEELEALIPESEKRPVRYGKKWLVKTAAKYI